jgi:alpha-tubulin suppressor-like RCC1 family protein
MNPGFVYSVIAEPSAGDWDSVNSAQRETKPQLNLVCDKSMAPLFPASMGRLFTFSNNFKELLRRAAAAAKGGPESKLYEASIDRCKNLNLSLSQLHSGQECFFLAGKDCWVYGRCQHGQLGVYR